MKPYQRQAFHRNDEETVRGFAYVPVEARVILDRQHRSPTEAYSSRGETRHDISADPQFGEVKPPAALSLYFGKGDSKQFQTTLAAPNLMQKPRHVVVFNQVGTVYRIW